MKEAVEQNAYFAAQHVTPARRCRPRKTSHEQFRKLVRKGWVNARGQVTKLLGGTADPEPNYETWTGEESHQRHKKKAL